jgi:hypothetical protein
MPLKTEQPRKYFQKRDLFLICVIIIIALVVYSFSQFTTSQNGMMSAEIYCNSKLVVTIKLLPSLNEKIAVPTQPNVVLEIKNSKIRFFSSNCRDKICVKAGFLDSAGQAAACLPNRVAIKIISSNSNNVSQADVYAT